MSHTSAPWVVARPTGAEERSAHPVADPALHDALARSQAGRGRLAGIVLGERLARTRGVGGRTVSHVWADAGVAVAVVPDPDPRTQSQRRQLLVDDCSAVRAWGERMRDLGAGLVWWPAASPIHCIDALVDVGLRPMLRVDRPVADPAQDLTDLVVGLVDDGCDLADVVLCVPSPPVRSAPPGTVGPDAADRFVTALVAAVPEQAGGVVVTADPDSALVGGADAAALARALAGIGAPWPVGFSAGGQAIRHAASAWQLPEAAEEAPARFDAVLDRLHRARREPLPGVVPPAVDPAIPPAVPARGDRFDTTLLRSRSLYIAREPGRP